MSKLYRKHLHLTIAIWVTKKGGIFLSSEQHDKAHPNFCRYQFWWSREHLVFFQCILEHPQTSKMAPSSSPVKYPSTQKLLFFTDSSFALLFPSVSVFTNPETLWHAAINILGVSVFPVRMQCYIVDLKVLQS